MTESRAERTASIALAAALIVGCSGAGGTEPGAPRPAADPAAVAAHREAAQRAASEGRPREAIAELARAIVLSPDDRALYQSVSEQYTRLEDDAGAVAFFGKLAEMGSGSAWPPFYRGFHAFRAGDWDDALADFERAAAVRPDDPEMDFRRALVLQATGDFDDALPFMERAHERDPSSEIFALRLSRLLRILGRYEEAGRVLETTTETHPDSAELLLALAGIREHAGELDTAEWLTRRAVALAPGHVQARRELSRLLLSTDRPDEATSESFVADRLADLEDALERLGGPASYAADAEAALTLADAELAAGNHDGAVAWLDLAGRHGASAARVGLLRAESAFLRGQIDEGDAALAQAESTETDPARSALVRATRAVAKGDANAARDGLRAVARGAATRHALRRAADLWDRLGEPGTARTLLERAATAPESPQESL